MDKTRNPIALALAGTLALLAESLAAAQSPPIEQLQYSADIGANIAGSSGFAARNEYVVDDTRGGRGRLRIPGLPARANLRDFQIDPNGDLLFCLDVGVTLGGVYFDPADVIKLANGAFSKAFDAASALVPKGVHCDGVARYGADGVLLLSFDKTLYIGGATIRPADVVAFSISFGTKVIDAQALGLPSDYNIDAVDSIGSTTDLLVSFDQAGSVGGIDFADEDILQYHNAGGTFSKRVTLLDTSDRWGPANLDGLAAAPNGDRVFKDGFE